MKLQSPQLTIKVFEGKDVTRTESLSQPVIKIGKLSSSHLQLSDASVSRMHAVLECTAEGVHIIDLGSSAGTRVNGKKISKATLQDGDTVFVGAVRLEMGIVEAQAAEPTLRQAPVGQAPVGQAPVGQAPVRQAPVGQAPVVAVASAVPAPAVAIPSSPPPLPAAPVATTAAASPMFHMTELQSATSPETQAVEVQARIGESVVSVEHLVHPTPKNTRNATRGILFAGAALLSLSAVGFATGISVASKNKSRHAEHLASGKPAHEFRPERLSLAFDWMALGGLAGGIALVGAGLLRKRDESSTDALTVGSGSGVTFPSSDAPTPDFELVKSLGDGFALQTDASWAGSVRIGAQELDLQEWMQGQAPANAGQIRECRLPADAEVSVVAGQQHFAIRNTTRARKQSVPLFANLDAQFAAYVGAAAVCILGFVFLLDTLKADEKTIYSDLFDNSDRLAMTDMKPFEEAIKDEPEKDDGESADVGGQGTKMAGPEGKMGDKEATAPDGQFKMAKTSDLPPAVARQMARDKARTSGILGAMAANPMAFDSPFANADFHNGLDDADIYGGLTGEEARAAAGGWGYGVNGMFQGGGGNTWGTVGTGDYGLIGHSDGTGEGYKAGDGKESGMRGHKADNPVLKIGPVNPVGGLDKEVIRRHVRKKLARIRHCYESQLVVNPGLSGTVTVGFQISPNGLVQGLRSGGMGNDKVESCVGDAIASIQFPQPEGGGYVNVRAYPFTFQPAGGR